MTKRRYPEDPPESPPKRVAPGPVAVVFALMLGAGVALTADTHADPQIAYKQVAQSITETLRNWAVEPKAYASLRMGDWPERLLALAQDLQPELPEETMPAIAVVLDDLGVNVARTVQAISLPANVTLSFLPYPPRSRELSHQAHLAGHEVIVHLPMQPSGSADPGDRALDVGLKPDQMRQRLEWALSRVSDYDGVNNHMGSRFTASRADLMPVMRELKARGLFFLDSRTTANTQVEAVAQELGMRSTRRDVFLDGDRRPAAIARQLSQVEEFARSNGNVIAIGHPYPETLTALASWTKTLRERGFRLASLRDVLLMREARSRALVTAGISFGPAP